jgi:MFS family permease
MSSQSSLGDTAAAGGGSLGEGSRHPRPGGGEGAPPLPLIFAITITGILANTLIGPAIPDILDAFHQPRARAGLLVSSSALPGIVMAPIIGVLADRLGRRAVLIPCLVAFGAFGVLSGLAPSFPVLLALRFGQGIGAAGLINLAVVIISDHWSGLDRARLIGQNAAVLTISLALVPPIGGVLTELGGWRLSFAPYAIGFVTALLLARRLPDVRRPDFVPLREQLRRSGSVFRRPAVISSVIAGFIVFVLVFGLFLAVLPGYLEDEFGLSAGLRGLVIASPAVTSTISALNLGRLRRRFGSRQLALVASVLFAIAFVIIGLAPSLPILIVGTMLYGFGEGVFIPTLQDRVSGAATPETSGAIVASWVGFARAGQTIGPIALASLASATGVATAFVIGSGLALVILLAEALARSDPATTPAPL